MQGNMAVGDGASIERSPPIAGAGMAASLREDFLCSAFAAILKRDFVERDQDFFTLGGDSLGATLAIGQIRDRLDASASTRRFFELRTPARLACEVAPTSAGFDSEDLPDGADGTLSIWAVPAEDTAANSGAGSRPPFVQHASVECADLGVAIRQCARAHSVAPSVFYLNAWLELLARWGNTHYPLELRLGEGAVGGSESWLIAGPPVRAGNLSASDVGGLQRHLLRGPLSSNAMRLREAPCSTYSYVRVASARQVPLSRARAPVELAIFDGPETRVDLSADAALPLGVEAALNAYLEQLKSMQTTCGTAT